MRRFAPILGLALAACGGAPDTAETPTAGSVVRVSLPDEPAAPWSGTGGAVIERSCVACHSPEMIATQPPLAPEKWQATIDKMRTVYHAQIPETDDAALVAALVAVGASPPVPAPIASPARGSGSR